MFDNLRDPGDSFIYEEEQNDLYKEPAAPTRQPAARPSAAPRRKQSRSKKFLGLTAQQRFIVALMLFFTVCIMGTLAMFVMGRMSIF